jgi:hypothetical protein
MQGSGYVRHRDEEFTGPDKPKQQLLAEFDAALAMVVATIGMLSEADWSASYSAVGTEMADRFSMVLKLRRAGRPSLGPDHLLAEGIARQRRPNRGTGIVGRQVSLAGMQCLIRDIMLTITRA